MSGKNRLRKMVRILTSTLVVLSLALSCSNEEARPATEPPVEFEQDELAWPEELPRFVAVDAGSFHALALDEEGFLWAWG
uniref:RCC1 domain-containing protein n=1 Tax=Alkalispirochaeta alkalica TaxID=46356 RepID=UPI0012FDFC0A